MPPKLSILLPTHNRRDTVEIALESLFAQDFTDWEVLVVGDGCTDGTGEMIEQLQRRDSRVRWFDLPKGPGFGYANRNIALKKAEGELVGFMADDDIVFSNHVGRLVELMQDDAAHIAAVGSLWVDARGYIVPAVGPLHDRGYREIFFAGNNRLPASVFIHRRLAFDELGYWREDLKKCGDLDFWQRIIARWGEESIRMDPHCSCVHFRAPWKQKGLHPDPHDSSEWKKLISEQRLGEELHISDKSGGSLQQALWQRLQNDPESAVNLRQAAVRALESYAYVASVMCHDALQAENIALVHERERAEKWKVKQRQQIARAERWKERAESYRDELNSRKGR